MNFINIFQERFPFLQPNDFKSFLAITSETKAKKGDKIIDIGEKKRKGAIILKGIVRGYLINYKGVEITTFLFKEYKTVAAYEPFILNQPSKHTFECLEKSELLLFDFADLELLAKSNVRIKKVMDTLIKENLLTVIKRNESFITQSPEKRYLSFVEYQTDLLRRVSQKHIASYLGITPVSFSRLKRRIYKQQESAKLQVQS